MLSSLQQHQTYFKLLDLEGRVKHLSEDISWIFQSASGHAGQYHQSTELQHLLGLTSAGFINQCFTSYVKENVPSHGDHVCIKHQEMHR